ncbi:hypothetical protein AAC387_Pa12g0938 [Persea americana]
MLEQEEENHVRTTAGPRKTFWRSASWSARSPTSNPNPTPHHHPNPRSRPCLPPLQPLSITRRLAVDEWPRAGSDDIGEWQPPSTPGGGRIDFPMRRDKLAFFDKECSRIADHVFLGSDAVARDRQALRRHGITHVLNCVGFVCPEYFRGELVYKTLWLQDSATEDITSILYDVFDYLEEVREGGGRVLVHCCQGVSRSSSLVIAYLMWRNGQSFEEAFQFVKSARGVTNPNMGFACQLLQCQKRVHAAPISPNSGLRMYRIAPHSPYDPLHLVPKSLPCPGAHALDSRGAFLIHVPHAIFVWVGTDCSASMARCAGTAAAQVVRYERANGPIVEVREGGETAEFWGALSAGQLVVDGMGKSSRKKQIDIAMRVGVGCKKVDSYDVDFEIFQRAVRGGVVPPFPLSGTGSETRLPARENGWCRLRRKLARGSVKEFVTTSLAHDEARSVDNCSEVEEAPPSPVPVSNSSLSPSPPCRSPESYSDSNNSSKLSSKSPSPSPTDTSSLSTFSPSSSNWSEFSFSSSQSSPRVPDFIEPFTAKRSLQEETAILPCKGTSPSLAERRGGNAPSLTLLSSADAHPQVPRIMVRSWSFSLPSLEGDLVMDRACHEFECKNSHQLSTDTVVDREVQTADQEDLGENFCFESNVSVGDGNSPQLADTLMEDQEPSVLTDLSGSISDLKYPILFQWPGMEKIEMFRAGVLDSRSVFLLLAPNMGLSSHHKTKMLYVWVGCDVAYDGQSHLSGGNSTHEGKHVYWQKVGSDFLYQMKLPADIPVQVVCEADEAMQFLNNIHHFNPH